MIRLRGKRPKRKTKVLAHRGASGYLPELSLASVALAHAMGADYLEIDVVMSADGVPVAFHDHTLEATTDAEALFPDRARKDGARYVVDFEFEELRRLTRRERFADRYPREATGFGIATFEEVLQLVRALNERGGCSVGVMVELKGPGWYREQGLPVEERVAALLQRFGFVGDVAYVLSFDVKSLKRMRSLTGPEGRVVQLVGAGSENDPMVTDEGLDAIAVYADAIGPSKRRIESRSGMPVNDGRVVGMAQSRGLEVFPYTLRADRLPRGHESFESEVLAYADRYGVDGIFTDHPDQALSILGRSRPGFARLDGRCVEA
ncbi:glycerophosphodiester phosphodiesterase family protein [Thioalkalivibrio sp. ALE31]|uniref:glycerophosphodiester phosphodiesterase family protein n=1 Tax=Thioalkalivibrio sp. ALE31 TaxID=1158182 RepID=UPI0003A82597|nr:glycerophosphodiester phosphodiesterase family protein [Thioalkalivibrio sp. ALE31]